MNVFKKSMGAAVWVLAGVLCLVSSPSHASYSFHDHVDATGSAVDLKGLQASPTATEGGAVALNNKVCPVTGMEAPAYKTVEHNGLVYNVCNARAYVRMRKNPGKYALSETEASALKKKLKVV